MSKRQGVAIAVGAVVDAANGTSGVYPALLGEGMQALRKRLDPRDYPEAIIACDTLPTALSIRVPGINTIGIAAESDVEIPGMVPQVPCVIALPELLRSISPGDVLILDANKGLVYVDPDPRILIAYQQREPWGKVYIAGEHIPARTQTGATVRVYALVTRELQLERALEEGADGVIVDLRSPKAASSGLYERVLRAAAGKPVAFAVDGVTEELARAALHYSSPHEVTVLFPPAGFAALLAQAGAALEQVAAEAFFSALDPPQLDFGVIGESYLAEFDEFEVVTVIDTRTSPLAAPAEQVDQEHETRGGLGSLDNAIPVLDTQLDAIERVVVAGARCIVVAAELVREAKDTVRAVGLEDEP